MPTPRIDYRAISPDGFSAVLGLENYIQHSTLPIQLRELVKMRASQINGCAYCLDMHAAKATEHGETHQRLHLLPAWRETKLFSEKEQAALAWTEAVTDISNTHAPDATYAALRDHFNDAEIVDLTLLISLINMWNRLAIAFRAQPEHSTN